MGEVQEELRNMILLKCEICEGNVIPNADNTTGVCDSCGTKMVLPSITDQRRADVFNRGNEFRKVYKFDEALNEYAQVVKEDPTDAEAHWCMMLCRYGINYQEDYRTGEWIPTCDRVSYTPVTEDPDYKAALQYANPDQRALYEERIVRIAAIQQGILELSAKEDPFDVFICFKDTDDISKKRTQDSVLAQDIYDELTKKGFKVFFSRITLKEEHMGEEWEPYIFAALNSAKVMVVVGTSRANFDAPWVKNEWSRFLHLRRSDKSKILVPCVKGMDPGELPPGLKELEGRDMSEISFMQDLTYGIERVVRGNKKTQSSGSGNKVTADNYVKRAFMAIEDGDFKKGDQMLEQALNLDPENGQAHLGKLLVDLKCTTVDKLADQEKLISRSAHYNRAVKYGDVGQQQKLKAAEAGIQRRLEQKDKSARLERLRKQMNEATSSKEMREVISGLESLKDFGKGGEYYATSKRMLGELEAKEAKALEVQKQQAAEAAAKKAAEEEAARLAREAEQKKYKRKRRRRKIRRTVFWLIVLAIIAFVLYNKFVKIPAGIYAEAEFCMEQGDYRGAAVTFFEAGNYSDAQERAIEACTLWLGWEPVVLTTEEYPWWSVDDMGGLQYDPSVYDANVEFALPTILDGELVTGIGNDCFYDTDGLKSLNLPANYTWIGENAFANCENLGAFTCQGVESIGFRAFYNCDSLTQVILPETVRTLGEGAFEDCDYINNMTLNEGLVEIGEHAFYSCGSITAITIPSTVETMGYEAFYNTSILNLTIAEGCSVIGERAFADNQYLTEVVIPGSVKTIGREAFAYSGTIGSVVLGEGVEVIGEGAFSSCPMLWSLSLPETLVEIGPYAFAHNYALGTMTLPGSLMTIGESAFYDCDNIQKLGLADNNGLVVGNEAFASCDNLAAVYVGAGTKSLGDSAFDYCVNLSWLSLGEGLESIGAWCFSNNILPEVVLPSTLTTLGEGAFYNNDTLVGATVPGSVTIIEEEAFYGCDSLYWVWFADGLSIIRDDAFAECPILTQVWYSGTAEQWNAVSKGNNERITYAQVITDYYES